MLKYFAYLIFACTFINTVSANVVRVNNSLTTDANQKIYKTIQAAHDAAAAGDTLMIEGSATEYAVGNITKRLTLIGPGYLLTENPQTQANPAKAVVQGINLNAGSSGSVLMGLTFATYYNSYTPYVRVNNILITRCYLPHPVQLEGNISNLQITQNFFLSAALEAYYNNYTFTNVTVRNNFIGGDLKLTSTNEYQRVFSAIENNIFIGSVVATTTTFRSNIIVTSTATVTVASASIENNLVSNGQIPTGNGNQTYTTANLFVGPTGNSTDGQYNIKAGSPYLTAGYGGTQPGIFGGSQPYVLSGMPPIPSIYEFTADGVANKTTGLPIKMKVKANQ